MKKALLLMALFAGSLLSANAQDADHLTAFVKLGETSAQKQLSVRLKNAVEYTAFQMKLTLPTGLKFTGDAPVLSARKDATHQVFCNKIDDQNMKVVVFSSDKIGAEETPTKGNLAFTDTKGELFLVNVTVTDEAYVAKDIAVSEVEFVKKADLKGAELAVTAKGKLGDADGNNSLTPYDATCVLLDLVDSAPTGYVKEAADMDANENITPYDATLILLELVK